MNLVDHYRDARHEETLARLRRVLVLRAMLEEGRTQREIAASLGVSQSAVSQQLRSGPAKRSEDVADLVVAAAPLLKRLAAQRGFTDLAVFGSVARGHARTDSDVDLLVTPPPDTSIRDMVRLQEAFERILERPIDLISRRGLRRGIDDDVLRDAVPL